MTFSAAALRVVLGVRADDGDGIPQLEDLLVTQDGTVPAVPLVGGEGDQPGDPVLALHVLVGDHLEDPRHLLGLGDIHAFDVGVGDLGLDQGKMKRVGRQLETQIRPIIQGARDLGQGRGTGILASPDLAVLRDSCT